MSEPSGERTEKATPRRMKDVREKGKLSRSQDLTAWVGIGAAVASMPMVLSRGHEQGAQQLSSIRAAVENPQPAVAVDLLGAGLWSIAVTLAPMAAAVVIAVLIAATVQGGVHLRKFQLKVDHFSPVNGIKKVFGTQALWQGAKAALKTAVVGSMLFVVIQILMADLLSVGEMSLSAVIASGGSGTMMLLQASIVAGIGLAVLDILVVAKRNRKHTMMTKQEVKDDTKRTEGDPLIKSQRRSRQLEVSRNRMIAEVANADVVIVNPVHVAVALRYTAGAGGAPKVVAKGVEHLALRIREEAATHRVPVIRDAPVARALNKHCALGQEIPQEHFTAVARILAFVMALKARGVSAGVHTSPSAGAWNNGAEGRS